MAKMYYVFFWWNIPVYLHALSCVVAEMATQDKISKYSWMKSWNHDWSVLRIQIHGR